MRSGELCKSLLHESFQMLPLASRDLENDRRRCGQAYPGAVAPAFWSVMQSPSTKDGLLNNNLTFFTLTFRIFTPYNIS